MAEYDGTVNIGTSIDTREFNTGLAQMERSCESFSRSTLARIAGVVAAWKGLSISKDFLASGVQYNRQLENARLGIATILTLNEKLYDGQGRLLQGQDKFNKAMEMSVEMAKALDVASIQSPAQYQPLLVAFQTNLSQASRLGLEWRDVLDITVDMSNVLSAMNVPMENLARETNSILTGEKLSYSQVAKRLGITREEIKAWGQGEELLANLTKRFQDMQYAGAAVEKTYEAVSAYFDDVRESLAGQVSGGLVDSLKTAMMGISDAFYAIDDKTKSFQITPEMKNLVEAATELASAFGGAVVGGVDVFISSLQSLSSFLGSAQKAIHFLSGGLDDLSVLLLAVGVANTRLFKSMTTRATPANFIATFKSLENETTLWKALKGAVTGNTEVLAVNSQARLKSAQAAAVQARAERIAAQATLDSSKAALAAANSNVNLATPAGQAARAAAIAQVTKSQNELAAATRRVIQAEAAQVQAETVHTAIMNESAVASARAAEVEARAAVARTQHALTNIQAKIAVAEQNGALKTREALLRSQITLEGRLMAQQAALTAAINARIAAMNSATISERLLAAAHRGLQNVWAMLGGGWGVAFMAATYGVYKLSTAESDAERINRKYSDAIAEAAEQMKKYRAATNDAEKGVVSWSQTAAMQRKKQLEADKKAADELIKGALSPSAFNKLVSESRLGMDRGTMGSILGSLPEDIRKEYLEIVKVAEEGGEDLIERVSNFSDKYRTTLDQLASATTVDDDTRDGAKRMMAIIAQLEQSVDSAGNHVEGLLVVSKALGNELNKLGEDIEANEKRARGGPESFDEFVRRLQEDEDDITAVFDRLEKAGVNLSNLNFFDLSDQIESVNKDTASYKEALTKFIDVLSSKESEVRRRLEGEEAGGRQYEQLLAMAEHYASLRLMVERELASGLLVIKAAEIAEFKVLEAEKEKGAKFETEERKKLLLVYARAYFESNDSQIASEKEKSIRLLEIQSACIRQMLDNLHTLAIAGDGAANSIYESMIGNYTMGQEALEAARAEYKKWRDESEGRQAELMDSLKDKLGGMGEGSGGGGGGGPATDAAKDAKEAVKALEEVELTLARMKGDKLKVVELESLKELRSFTDLLEKAGVTGEEAAGMIRDFKAAQAATVETESLRSQLEFYEKIKIVVPEARAQYELLREKLLELEAVQLEMQGIPPAMVDIYIDTERLAEATDALSGIRRAVRDYTADLTPAQLAEEMFSSSISSISDALTEGIWNVDSFGDAMSNLGDTIIKSLQKMMVEMLIVRPIMEVFSTMLDSLKAKSAGGGGFFGFLGGLFGFGHSGGIIGAGTLPKKLVSPLAFAGARRFHSGGIIPGLKSKEIPIIARQGEVILTQAQQRQLLNILDGKSGSGSNAGVELNVSVVNQTSVKVDAETRTKQNQDGSGMDVTVLLKEIDDGLAKRQSQGNSSMDRQIRSTYQLNDAMSVYRGG